MQATQVESSNSTSTLPNLRQEVLIANAHHSAALKAVEKVLLLNGGPCNVRVTNEASHYCVSVYCVYLNRAHG